MSQKKRIKGLWYVNSDSGKVEVTFFPKLETVEADYAVEKVPDYLVYNRLRNKYNKQEKYINNLKDQIETLSRQYKRLQTEYEKILKQYHEYRDTLKELSILIHELNKKV